MGKRFAILIGAAALGAALIATGASANFRSFHDPRGDTECGGLSNCSDSQRRNADIVRATAGHAGGRLKHTIHVVGKFKKAELVINIDSDPTCELFLVARRGHGTRFKFRECSGGGPVSSTGRARYDFHHHSVEIFFSESSIGNPQSYGWRLRTLVGAREGSATDTVPNLSPSHYIRHRLAQPAAASAGVHKYDTELTVTKDRTAFYHGYVKSEVRKCERGRRVVLFKRRPGADRRLGTARSNRQGGWGLVLDHPVKSHGVYGKAKRKVRDRFVCRADRSAFHL
jgi:hypothetical protein